MNSLIIYAALTGWPWIEQFFDPGQQSSGGGYWAWSGILSGSPIFAVFATSVLLWWRRHNCHVSRCWHLQWHVHPDHGHPVCRRHHPDGKKDIRKI